MSAFPPHPRALSFVINVISTKLIHEKGMWSWLHFFDVPQSSIQRLELATGIEPATWALQEPCSAYWATPAYLFYLSSWNIFNWVFFLTLNYICLSGNKGEVIVEYANDSCKLSHYTSAQLAGIFLAMLYQVKIKLGVVLIELPSQQNLVCSKFISVFITMPYEPSSFMWDFYSWLRRWDSNPWPTPSYR